jgi:hypothetical protein
MRPEDVRIPEEALSETFLASTGPGGQNVNKVATACQLRCDVYALGLPLHAYEKLKVLAGSKLTLGGELVITARTHLSPGRPPPPDQAQPRRQGEEGREQEGPRGGEGDAGESGAGLIRAEARGCDPR